MTGTEQEPVGLLLVDKPSGVTSHDVVGRVRGILRTRRVGHAGTLDPMASGLLIVAVGRATKLLGHLALHGKSYTATMRLGAATDTDDADGTIVSTADASGLTADRIAAVMRELTGEIQQVPSTYSAIKVDGRRAYDLARSGEEVRLAARPVTVTSFEITAPPRYDGMFVDVDVSVDCSSGTYVRALARDVGRALGVGAHLTALRRTSTGPFTVERAVDVFPDGVTPRGEPRPPIDDALRAEVAGGVIPVDEAVRKVFALREVTDREAADLGYGRPLDAARIPGTYAAVSEAGEFLALLAETGPRAKPVFVWRAA